MWLVNTDLHNIQWIYTYRQVGGAASDIPSVPDPTRVKQELQFLYNYLYPYHIISKHHLLTLVKWILELDL